MFPNPTAGALVLNLAHYEGQALRGTLLDVAQHPTLTINLTPDHLRTVELDVNHLAAGVYTLVLSSERGTHTERVVVRK